MESARVGENGLIPIHEAVQPAVLRDHVQPRTQPQVKGVAQNNLRLHGLEFHGRHRLHGTVGTHRHEDRRFHDTVIQRHAAAAGLAFRLQ